MRFVDMENAPLVSVVVVTYNSSATVIETLESIKNQTYRNIELIVSDDCSKDDTIDVARQWLKENDSRFVGTELVTAEHNTGVSGNLNRGIQKSHGEWIKSIAGDDLLISFAIDDYVNYVINSPERVEMCVCDVKPFATDGELPEYILDVYKNYFKYECESYEMQRKRVMTRLVFLGPTFFFHRDLYDEIAGFSEEYGNTEEWPFVYKVLKNGNRIFPIRKQLVLYRINQSSLCRMKEKNGLGNEQYFQSTYKFFFDYPFNDLLKECRYMTAWHYYILYRTQRLRYSMNNNVFSRILQKIIKCFDPYVYAKRVNLIES